MNLEVHQAAIRMYYNEKQMRPFTRHPLPDPTRPGNAETREANLRARSIQNFTPMSGEAIRDWLNNRYPRRKAGEPSQEESFADPL
jgi:hypothetical protein